MRRLKWRGSKTCCMEAPLQPIDTVNRTDLIAILLTEVPGLNFTGSRPADLMAASQERLTAQVARVREEVFMRLSAKVEQLSADPLRAAQAEDDWRLNRVAEVTRVLSALEADLAEIAAARRLDGDRVQIEVHQALKETVQPEPFISTEGGP